MNCPQCLTEVLVMTERQGVEVDYCPRCRGVWLDRGELDKILERSVAELGSERPAVLHEPVYDERRYRYDDDDDDHYRYDPRYAKKRKRKNFLEEILDF